MRIYLVRGSDFFRGKLLVKQRCWLFLLPELGPGQAAKAHHTSTVVAPPEPKVFSLKLLFVNLREVFLPGVFSVR